MAKKNVDIDNYKIDSRKQEYRPLDNPSSPYLFPGLPRKKLDNDSDDEIDWKSDCENCFLRNKGKQSSICEVYPEGKPTEVLNKKGICMYFIEDSD